MTGEKNAAVILGRASACELVYLSPLAQIVVTEDVPWLLARHLELLEALKELGLRFGALVLASGDLSEANANVIDLANAAIAKAEGAQ